VVTRTLFGPGHWYEVPAFDFTRLSQLPWFLVLGILCGVLGALFLKLLRWSDALCSRMTVPLYARMAVAGLAVGTLAVAWRRCWATAMTAPMKSWDDRSPWFSFWRFSWRGLFPR